jgi:hypothetical protein
MPATDGQHIVVFIERLPAKPPEMPRLWAGGPTTSALSRRTDIGSDFQMSLNRHSRSVNAQLIRKDEFAYRSAN